MSNICAACGVGNLHAKKVPDLMEYKGVSKNSELYYSECDNCGTETATESDLAINKVIMEEFKLEVQEIFDII